MPWWGWGLAVAGTLFGLGVAWFALVIWLTSEGDPTE